MSTLKTPLSPGAGGITCAASTPRLHEHEQHAIKYCGILENPSDVLWLAFGSHHDESLAAVSRKLFEGTARSVQSTSFQIVCNDRVSNCIKYKIDVLSVRCTSQVNIDFFFIVHVLDFELFPNVVSSIVERIRTCG